MTDKTTLEMLEIVADGFSDLLDRVVFVGGATVILHMDSPSAPEPRPTEDVDCVVNIRSRLAMNELEQQLRDRGFQHDLSKGAPICRWIFRSILVDVMPTDPNILGFTNEWYVDGIAAAERQKLPNGLQISVFSLPYFLASKLSAFKSRGQTDVRSDPDLEDIFLVLDGNSDPLETLRRAKRNVLKFIGSSFRELVANPLFPETLEGTLGREGPERLRRLQRLIQEIVLLA